MDVRDKVVVVTGGGSGIGAALCARFAREGARGVAVMDLNEANAQRVAAEIGGLALRCDVSQEADVKAAIGRVEAELGPIDLFCSNAGVLVSDANPEDPASASDELWRLSWDVHVMAHVYAARDLAPKMASRGSGYFLNTISAAGLLTQIGSGPYAATKHAAVGFAETLAIAYRDRGIGVSILCPQGVSTPMVEKALKTPAVADGIIGPEEVADVVIEGLREEKFLILPHPQVLGYMQRKTDNYDRWLGGMRKFYRQAVAAPEPAR